MECRPWQEQENRLTARARLPKGTWEMQSTLQYKLCKPELSCCIAAIIFAISKLQHCIALYLTIESASDIHLLYKFCERVSFDISLCFVGRHIRWAKYININNETKRNKMSMKYLGTRASGRTNIIMLDVWKTRMSSIVGAKPTGPCTYPWLADNGLSPPPPTLCLAMSR